jgi:DNA polymerase-1
MQVSQSGLKETRTLGGRRRLWQVKTNLPGLLNSPVQGTSADITKRALSMLPKTLNGTGAKIIGTVHDEIILEVPQENLQKVAPVLQETMESAGRYYLKKIPVEVDVSIVDSLAKN